MLATLGPGNATSAEGADWFVAARSHDEHNGTFESGGIAVAIEGEIATPESVRSNIPIESRPDPSASVPEIIHAYYRAWGAESLTKLNGVYAIVIYDDNEKRVHVVTDRTGFRWVYYWSSPGRIVVTTQARAIAALPDFPKDTDSDAVYDMLAFGYCLNDRTLFKNIRLLGAGSILTATADAVAQECHCEVPADGAADESESLEDYVEEFARLYKQAVERQFHDRVCVQPTGGFDSRSIAAMISLCREDETVLANTMGPADSLDVMAGRKIAHDLGIDHTVLPNPEDYLERYGRESVWLNDGSTLMQTCWRMGQGDWLEANRLRHIMHGHLGYMLKGSRMTMELVTNFGVDVVRDKLVENVGGVSTDDEVDAMLGSSRAKVGRDNARQHIHALFDSAKSESIYRKYENAVFQSRERRYIAVYRYYFQQHCRVHIPIADQDFFDFLVGLPLSVRLNARVLTAMLKKYAPRSLRAPLVATGIPPGAGPITTARYRVWGRFYYKVLPMLTGGAIGTKNRNVYIDYAGALRTGSRAFVENTMARAEGIGDLIDVGEARTIVNGILNSDTVAYGQVYALLTLIHWHELFREGKGYSEFAES